MQIVVDKVYFESHSHTPNFLTTTTSEWHIDLFAEGIYVVL